MKQASKFCISFLILVSNIAFAAMNTPVGWWKTIDDETGKVKAIVQITESKNKTLVGKIIKIYPRPGYDQNEICNACEGERHNKPIVGMVFLEKLNRSADTANAWTNGQILDPKNGKVYHCNVSLSENGENLNVRGYLGLPLFGRTQTWIRVNNLNEV